MSETITDPEAAEQTEAYRTLLARVGRKSHQDPARGPGSSRLGVRPGPRMAGTGRGDGRPAASAGVGPARPAPDRRPARGRAPARPLRDQAAGLDRPALSHDRLRSRPDRGPVRLPRLHKELAGRLQAHPDRAGAPLRPAPAPAAGVEGAAAAPRGESRRAALGPDPAADGTWRLAGAHRLVRPARGQGCARRPLGAGPEVVPSRGGRRLRPGAILRRRPPATPGPGRGPAQGRPRRGHRRRARPGAAHPPERRARAPEAPPETDADARRSSSPRSRA